VRPIPLVEHHAQEQRTAVQHEAVAQDAGWESSATDIIGIHDYDADPQQIAQRYSEETNTEQLFDRRRDEAAFITGAVLNVDGGRLARL
jgi:hypothetical protein